MYCGLLWFYCEHTSFVQFHMFATGCMQVYRYIDLNVALPWYLTICNDSLYNWILAILLRWNFVGISLGHCGKRFCHKMFASSFFVRMSLGFRWNFVGTFAGLSPTWHLQQQAQQSYQPCDEVRQTLATNSKMFQPPIATILFGGKMLWQSVLPQAKVR